MAGQYADDETELFYNYFRYYDPKTGRYVTSDPLGLADGTNSYNYVHGNPLSKVDPNGQFAFLVVNPYTIGLAINTIGILATIAIDISIDDEFNRLKENTCNNCSSMSKGGTKNVDNEYVRMIQYKECGDEDPCKFLKKLYDSTKNNNERKKIKIALKRYNCDGKNRNDRKK